MPLAGCATTQEVTVQAPDISIHKAAENGNIEAVKQRLATGTDVNAKSKNGCTPLRFAANKEVAELLLADGAEVNANNKRGRTPLHASTTKEVAELLFAYGANVNAKTRTGRTPLHNGYSKGIVELLIAKGVNVNALILSGPHQGKTPLDTTDNKETADLLCKHVGKTGEEIKAKGGKTTVQTTV